MEVFDFNVFLEDVRRMRELQKEYFKSKSRDVLVSAKQYEVRVDAHLSNLPAGKDYSAKSVETLRSWWGD